jgi:hypothetical protein
MNLLPLLLLPLVACTNADTDDTSVSDDTASTDDTATDSGGDDTGDSVELADCMPAHGVFRADSQWIYTWTNTTRTGSAVAEVVAYDPTQNTFSIRTEEAWADTGGSNFSGWDQADYWCDADGLYLLATEREYSGSTAGNPYGDASQVVYDAPYLLRPNNAAMGDTWSSAYSAIRTDADGNESALSGTLDAEVIGDNALVAGIYRSLEIKTTFENGNFDSYYWMHEVGMTGTYSRRLAEHTQ